MLPLLHLIVLAFAMPTLWTTAFASEVVSAPSPIPARTSGSPPSPGSPLTPKPETTPDDLLLNEIFILYKKGDYHNALGQLGTYQIKYPNPAQTLTTPASPENPGHSRKIPLGTVEYWKGICLSKLQEYDQAAVELEKAKKLGFRSEDLNYELGQSLYAAQKLPEAMRAFRSSEQGKFKIGASLYYQGFISQILEKYSDSLRYYTAIHSLAEDPDEVKQPALLQIAEVRASQAEAQSSDDAKEKSYRRTVIPLFRRVIDYKKGSPSAKQAQVRIDEIQNKLQLMAHRMVNGVPIGIKPWSLSLSQDLKYDSNVIFQSNDALIKISNKDSPFSKTDLQARYQFVFKRTVATILDFDANNTIYLNRTEPSVYQNDLFSATPAIRNKYEHSALGGPATTLLDLEFNYILRDYSSTHNLLFFSKYTNLVLGERMNLFTSRGGTTVLLNFKWFTHEDPGQTANDPGFTINQNFAFGESVSLAFTFNFDWNRAVNPTWDRINYRLAPNLTLSKLFLDMDLNLDLSISIVDTVLQQPTRGYEKLIAPTLSLIKSLGTEFYLSLSGSYSRNFSLDLANYAYTKGVVGIRLGMNL